MACDGRYQNIKHVCQVDMTHDGRYDIRWHTMVDMTYDGRYDIRWHTMIDVTYDDVRWRTINTFEHYT